MATATATGEEVTTERVQRGNGQKLKNNPTDFTSATCARHSPLLDSTPLWHANPAALALRLRHQGYVFLRGVVPAQLVADARSSVLAQLAAEVPGALAPGGADAQAGSVAAGLLGRPHVAKLPTVAALLEHSALFALAAAVLATPVGEVATCAYKWLRAVSPGEFTGVHCDVRYVSGDIVTLWIPIGDVPLHMGGLLIAHGSNRLTSFSRLRSTYLHSPLGADGAASGWLCASAAGLDAHMAAAGQELPQWHGGDVYAGDVVVLAPTTWHVTVPNATSQLRISCDTRWQASSGKKDARLTTWTNAGGDNV
jgi:ectoine hydroxylase-related dioxygenase (phytanoyl-CoA dioxygenase family)